MKSRIWKGVNPALPEPRHLWNFIDKRGCPPVSCQVKWPGSHPDACGLHGPKTQPMKGYYELKKTAAGKFHFTLKAGNHEIILSSQSYSGKDGAEGGIASVRAHGQQESRYERKLSAVGEPYFVLKSANGEAIGTSEMYGSEASRDNGIQSVIANSPSQTVKDLTA